MHPSLKAAWLRLPRPARDTIATVVDRVRGVPILAPPIPPDVTTRIFFGPVNYAGQATAWARALERDSSIAARTMVGSENNGFGYPVDYEVPWRTMEHSRAWQRGLLEVLRDHYTHVAIEATVPLLGGLHGRDEGGDLLRQVDDLRDAGLDVWMIGHGTDVRLPSRHRALEPWSPFRNDDWIPFDTAESVVAANIAAIEAIDGPTFVSTPGLLLDLPDARYVPLTLDSDRWASATEILVNDRLRIMHAPSNPAIKGTSLIEPVLQRLGEAGVADYVRVQGVPNERLPEFYSQSDILLDQFFLGDYGVAACEAMASGRLVVSHVSKQARDVVEATTGLELPIVEATIESLEDVLHDIDTRRDHYREIAARGPAFVRAAHDGERSRAVFVDAIATEGRHP